MDSERRRRVAGPALLLAVALIARLVVFAVGSDRPTNDELAYQSLATEIAAGNGFARDGRPETHIAPLFPLLHALPIALGADPHWAGRAVGLVSSALAAPLIAWALCPLLGCRWSLLGGLLVAVHPRLLVTAERMQPEALAAALLLLFCGWWLRDRAWGVVGAAALAYLARPEAVVLLPLAVLVAIAGEKGSRWRWLAPTLLALVIAAPYVLHLRQATGQWTLSGKTTWVYALGVMEARQGSQPTTVEALRQVEAEVGSPLRHLRQQPVAAVAGYFERSSRSVMYLGAAVWWPFLALALVGLVELARARERVGGLLIPLALLLVIPIGVVHARHLLPYVPLLLGAAGCGLRGILFRLRPGEHRMGA